MKPLPSFVIAATCCQALLAQFPANTAIVWELPMTPNPPSSHTIIDLGGGGAVTWTQGSPIPLFVPTAAIATDPTDPARLFWLAPTPSLGIGLGTFPIGFVGEIAGPLATGAWNQNGGLEIEVGASSIVTLLPSGAIEVTPKAGGTAQIVATVADAVDIALVEPFLYVATVDPLNPSALSPLVEVNLNTTITRVVGSYAELRCIAARAGNPTVAVGTSTGAVLEVDIATGNVTSSFPAGFGVSVEGLAYSPQGLIVYATVSTFGGGYLVWAQGVPQPIHGSQGNFIDLTVATAPSAASVPFGVGCGAGSLATWQANGLPTLGNANYTMEVQQAPASAPLALFLGESRMQSQLLGVLLPYDLQAYGAPSCWLRIEPRIALGLVTNAGGTASQTVPIPSSPQLLGNEFYAQAFVPDASVGSLGFAATSGLAFVVR